MQGTYIDQKVTLKSQFIIQPISSSSQRKGYNDNRIFRVYVNEDVGPFSENSAEMMRNWSQPKKGTQ
jgi:hypothetical protein